MAFRGFSYLYYCQSFFNSSSTSSSVSSKSPQSNKSNRYSSSCSFNVISIPFSAAILSTLSFLLFPVFICSFYICHIRFLRILDLFYLSYHLHIKPTSGVNRIIDIFESFLCIITNRQFYNPRDRGCRCWHIAQSAVLRKPRPFLSEALFFGPLSRNRTLRPPGKEPGTLTLSYQRLGIVTRIHLPVQIIHERKLLIS